MDGESINPPLEVSAPDQRLEDAEAVEAEAEVAAMARQRDGRGRDMMAEQAIMGASNDEGLSGVEAIDESGELVHQAFLQFLSQ